jgi:hypothetical protein
MGINTHVYSYWGVRTEWNDAVHDRYEEIEEANCDLYGYGKAPASSNVEILMDSMSGEYMVLGVQLYDSGDARWGEMTNSNEVDIYPEKMENLRHDYMERFKQLYPDQYEWLAAKPWRLVNLVHWS